MERKIINTPLAPAAIGTYSQAVAVNNTVYLSGQIALDPATGEIVQGSVEAELHQVFKNLQAVCNAAGGELSQIVKLNVYLTDFSHFPLVNQVMAEYIQAPYPARAAIGVAALPRNVRVEIDGVLVLD
jgi:reactive intermediate/imine deaminase